MVFLFKLSDVRTVDQLFLANLPGTQKVYYFIAVNFAGKKKWPKLFRGSFKIISRDIHRSI